MFFVYIYINLILTLIFEPLKLLINQLCLMHILGETVGLLSRFCYYQVFILFNYVTWCFNLSNIYWYLSIHLWFWSVRDPKHEGSIYIVFLKLKVLYFMLLLLKHIRVNETDWGWGKRGNTVIFCLHTHFSAFRMCGGSRAFCHS